MLWVGPNRGAEGRASGRLGATVRRLALILAFPLALAAPAAGQAQDPDAAVATARADASGREVSERDVSGRDVAASLRELLKADKVPVEVAAFYRARNYAPLWAPGSLRPEVEELAELVNLAADAPEWSGSDAEALARLELKLSEAYVDALRETPARKGFQYVDPQLTLGRGVAALDAAAKARDLGKHLRTTLGARNPMVADLEAALERYEANWGALPQVRVPPGPEFAPGAQGPRVAALRQRLALPGGAYDETLADAVRGFQIGHGLEPTGNADAATVAALNAGPARYEKMLAANIARAKLLPVSFGERFIVVDAAAGRLWYFEGGRERVSMKVVTGRPSQPTPMMVAMARHLIFNPYWNVPADLVRSSIAPKVLARGLAYIEDEGLQVLESYDDDAEEVDPATVNWAAVARGKVEVRVRQRPGPKNMMGQVKLMLPNPLGIYLHDTPLKGDFAQSQRQASAGCVRLEDAMALARALIGEEAADSSANGGAEEIRVELEKPIPVYITYFTAGLDEGRLVFRPDVYGRDRLKVAQSGATKLVTANAR